MILDSKLWTQDLDRVIDNSDTFDKLKGKTVLVTGATGLICSAVIDLFIRYNEMYMDKEENSAIRIIAAARNKEKVSSRFGSFVDKDYFNYEYYDATENELKLTGKADYIIHGASNAFPAKIIGEPVETMLSNFSGMYKLLEYAKASDTKRVLYVSSSEVYGNRGNDSTETFTENEYGYIDVLNTRSCYPISKRAAETLCVSYSAEYGVSTVIVRPGHIYGPTAAPTDNRISSEFAYMAAEGKDLVMKSAGSQMRSYMYCLDTASAMLKVLTDGENGKAYNVSNPDSIISIRQMAEYLAKAGGVTLSFDMPDADAAIKYSAMTNASLNSDSLEALGWKGLFGDYEGLEHTVLILRETAIF